MIGIYRVYEDGKLIREAKNKLTLLGRSNALSTMLGLTQSFAGSMGIGIDETANATGAFHDKTDLNFGVGKYPITGSSLGTSGAKDALIYTSRITDPSRYEIYELGLYSNQINGSADVDALTIFNFESGDALKETVSGTDYYIDDTATAYTASKKTAILDDGVNYRIGINALKVFSGTTVFYNDNPVDLSSFYEYDSLKLAFYTFGAVTVTIKFYSGTAHADYAFTGTTGTYQVLSKLKNSVTPSATMDWSNITKIELVVSGGTTGTSYAVLDGLRTLKDKPVDSIDGLISRVTFDNSTKISKTAGSIIDIEYLLIFDLDAG